MCIVEYVYVFFYAKFPKAVQRHADTRCFQYSVLRIRYAVSNLAGMVRPLHLLNPPANPEVSNLPTKRCSLVPPTQVRLSRQEPSDSL